MMNSDIEMQRRMLNGTSDMQRRLVTTAEVCRITGFSRFQIDRMEKNGEFPKRRRVSANRVAWLSDEIEAWLDSLPSEPTQGARKASQAA